MAQQIEPLRKSEAELRAAFWEQVRSFPGGDKITQCIQCGTCTGSCPVAYAMDITPRQTIALFRAGHIEDILHSRTIWICASCYSCTVRCPSEIKITDTMYALKRLAIQKKIYPPNFPVHALSRAFIDNVYRYGRNFELGLGMRYLMRTSLTKLFASSGFGLAMVRRHRLGIKPQRIKRISEVRAIINKANQFEE